MMVKNNKLNYLVDYFHQKLRLTPVAGVELEFYLSDNINVKNLSEIIGTEIECERGRNQFEIKLGPSEDLEIMAQLVKNTRKQITKYCKNVNGWADFSSKPQPDDFGNSMHIHLNFLEDPEIEKYAQILCANLAQYIQYCLPTEQDFLRLDYRYMAPTHICWGGNNRTAMVRIPASSPVRLEHRLPCAAADPEKILIAFLGIIANHINSDSKADINQFTKIYGNAFDQQYNLISISKFRS